MYKEPLKLPTPVLFVIALSSILLLFYLCLYAISKKPIQKDETNNLYGVQETYSLEPAATNFVPPPTADETISQEINTRSTAQSDFERMNQETEAQLQRSKMDRDLFRSQKSQRSF